MTAIADSGRSQYATFLIGGHYLGIGVPNVQEVLRDQPVTPVPLASELVAGLINLRGKIVPQLDMRRLLQLPAREADAAAFSVVVETEHGAVSLLVDEIEDVVELDASSFEPTPRNVEANVLALLLGVHRMPHRLLLILDIGRTVDVGGE